VFETPVSQHAATFGSRCLHLCGLCSECATATEILGFRRQLNLLIADYLM
jgi:hypothetical protein